MVADVDSPIEVQLSIACLSSQIGDTIPDTKDGTNNLAFRITTSSDYERQENVMFPVRS